MISLIVMENDPWSVMWLLPGHPLSSIGKNFGEWAWVGREYEIASQEQKATAVPVREVRQGVGAETSLRQDFIPEEVQA